MKYSTVKRFIILTCTVVVLSLNTSPLFADGSTFSTEEMAAALSDYFKFYQENVSVPFHSSFLQEALIAGSLPDEAAELEKQLKQLEDQNEVSRYAEALAEVFSAAHGQTFNTFLFQIMDDYLNDVHKRDAVKLLKDKIARAVSPDLIIEKNHRCWKSASNGAIEGFYFLMAVELIRSVGKKTNLLKNMGSGMSRLFNFVMRRKAAVEAAKTVVLEGAVAETGLISTVTGTTEASGRILAKWKLFGRGLFQNPQFYQKLIGKRGLSRLLRFLAAGACMGTAYGGYRYHFLEQKLDPDILFDRVQIIALLDLSARVWQIKNIITADFTSVVTAKTEDLNKLKNKDAELKGYIDRYELYKSAIDALAFELQHFLLTSPKFSGNIPLTTIHDPDSGKGLRVKAFIVALTEIYPQFMSILKTPETDKHFDQNDALFADVTHVSLAPIQVQLGEASLLVHRFEARLLE